MRYVGKTGSEEFVDHLFAPNPFMAKLRGEKIQPRPIVRRTDYPASTSKPPTPENFSDLFNVTLLAAWQDKTWWRSGTYAKKQRGEHVWITHYPKEPEAPGGGHKALRRLGWTAAYRTDRWVWVHPVLAILPWSVPSRDPDEVG